MKVFISWSGKPSKTIAIELRQMIRAVINEDQVFMSDTDIKAGDNWGVKLNNCLLSAKYAFFIIPPDGDRSEWVAYEAGAILSRGDALSVTPLIFGDYGDRVPSYLKSQQHIGLEKEKYKSAIKKIKSDLLEDKRFDDESFDIVFNLAWDYFLSRVNNIIESLEINENNSVISNNIVDNHSLISSVSSMMEEYKYHIAKIQDIYTDVIETKQSVSAINDRFGNFASKLTPVLHEIGVISTASTGRAAANISSADNPGKVANASGLRSVIDRLKTVVEQIKREDLLDNQTISILDDIVNSANRICGELK